jgi:hypothetical protein
MTEPEIRLSFFCWGVLVGVGLTAWAWVLCWLGWL